MPGVFEVGRGLLEWQVDFIVVWMQSGDKRGFALILCVVLANQLVDRKLALCSLFALFFDAIRDQLARRRQDGLLDAYCLVVSVPDGPSEVLLEALHRPSCITYCLVLAGGELASILVHTRRKSISPDVTWSRD